LSKFLYEEAIATVIIFMAVYASSVWGFSDSELTPFFVLSTVSAVIGSWAIGLLTDRLGPKRTLEAVLVGWLVCLTAVALIQRGFLSWLLGSAVGICLGGTWTAARPLLVGLVSEEELAEYFGLYAMTGKAAAILGPMVWAGVLWAAAGWPEPQRYRLAVGALAFILAVGLGVLRQWVPEARANPSYRA
jgi:UMF1 family MFS transporter